MRHGRKSRSKRFDGDKEHIAYDLDRHVILACAVTSANRPEAEGAAAIGEDIEQQGFTLAEVHVHRAYVNSHLVAWVQDEGGTVFAKPWALRAIKPGLFSKADFRIDLRAETITCTAGEVGPFEPGETVHFDPEVCGACPLRANCTQAASGRGRSISIARDEAQQDKFRKLQHTSSGRAMFRQRVDPPMQATALAVAHGTDAEPTATTAAAAQMSRTRWQSAA